MTRLTIIFAAAAILGALGGIGVWKVYQAGKDAERKASLERAVELVIERDKIDAKLKTATPADICRRLGGSWLPDTNECH